MLSSQPLVQFAFLSLFTIAGAMLLGSTARQGLALRSEPPEERSALISWLLGQLLLSVILLAPSMAGALVELPPVLGGLHIVLAVAAFGWVLIAWRRLRHIPVMHFVGVWLALLLVMLGFWAVGFGISEGLIGVLGGGILLACLGLGIAYVTVRNIMNA